MKAAIVFMGGVSNSVFSGNTFTGYDVAIATPIAKDVVIDGNTLNDVGVLLKAEFVDGLKASGNIQKNSRNKVMELPGKKISKQSLGDQSKNEIIKRQFLSAESLNLCIEKINRNR